jgi:hypothetical protein
MEVLGNVVYFKAEEIYFAQLGAPIGDSLNEAIKAREEGQLVLLNFCDCSDCLKGKEQMLDEVRRVFAGDPLVIPEVPKWYEGKDIVVLPSDATNVLRLRKGRRAGLLPEV